MWIFFNLVLTFFDRFLKKNWNVRSPFSNRFITSIWPFDRPYAHSCFRFVDIFPIVEEQKASLIRQQHICDISPLSVTISFFWHFKVFIFPLEPDFTSFLLLVLFRVQFYYPESFYLRCQLQFRVCHSNLVSCSQFSATLRLLTWTRAQAFASIVKLR